MLGYYNPALIACLGCDLHYSATAKTHFYGSGTPDPLRDDISLMSLEAKASRFYAYAREQDCDVTNLSSEPSRLTFPRQTLYGALPQTPDDRHCAKGSSDGKRARPWLFY